MLTEDRITGSTIMLPQDTTNGLMRSPQLQGDAARRLVHAHALLRRQNASVFNDSRALLGWDPGKGGRRRQSTRGMRKEAFQCIGIAGKTPLSIVLPNVVQDKPVVSTSLQCAARHSQPSSQFIHLHRNTP